MHEPTIIFENDDFIVVNKPSGLIVHEAHDPDEPTLVDWMLKRHPEIAHVGDDPLRPGIVHRLDKETSGVMVIAKTQSAFERLKKQFQDHAVEKMYTALVWGNMPDARGTIRLSIAKSKYGTKRTVRRKDSPTDKPAETDWTVVTRYMDGTQPLTLMSVEPKTGRTHQIRVHCAAIGHPVIGDYLYGGKTTRAYRDRLPRVFLHARRIAFRLDATPYAFEAPLAPELEIFLKTLAARADIAQ